MTWGDTPSILCGALSRTAAVSCALLACAVPAAGQDTPAAQTDATFVPPPETLPITSPETPPEDTSTTPDISAPPENTTDLTTSPEETDVIEWASVGGWDIGYYPASQGCLAFALFEQNTAFFIGFDNTGDAQSLDVTLVDQSWDQISDESEHSILVRFGDNPAWTLHMKGSRVEGFPALNIHIDSNSDEALQFIRQFQLETQMEWLLEGTPLARLTLSGSKRAFEEVRLCDVADHTQNAPKMMSVITDMPYPR